MATKAKTTAPIEADEPKFTKKQIIGAKRYENRRDVCNAVIPEGFFGTLAEADILIDNYMKGMVK
jgi:hypothetical protein